MIRNLLCAIFPLHPHPIQSQRRLRCILQPIYLSIGLIQSARQCISSTAGHSLTISPGGIGIAFVQVWLQGWKREQVVERFWIGQGVLPFPQRRLGRKASLIWAMTKCIALDRIELEMKLNRTWNFKFPRSRLASISSAKSTTLTICFWE